MKGREEGNEMNDPRDGLDAPGIEDEERRFSAWLKEVAADYHRPPATPREALWARVESGWRAAMAGEAAAETTETDGLPPVTWMAEGLRSEGLPAEAAEYNWPPPTPREEMWPRIEAAWKLRCRLPAGAREAGLHDSAREAERTEPREQRRARRAPWAWAVGLAATLVLGIAIGRQSVSELERQGTSPIATASSPAGEAATPSPSELGDEPGQAVPGEPVQEGRLAEGRSVEAEVGGGADTPPASPEGASAGGGTAAPSEPAMAGRDRSDDGAGGLAYRAAAIDHLGRAEAFLTSFRSGEATETTAAPRWARELLVDTRLLMDWSGDAEPRLSMLLSELELVLVQIATLHDDGGGAEREMIVDGMESRDVLLRLRSAIPAGQAGMYLQGT